MYPNIFREMALHGRMTIEQLSKKVGITPKTMSNKLNNKTQFTLDEMLKIQKEFGGIPLDELFYQSGIVKE